MVAGKVFEAWRQTLSPVAALTAERNRKHFVRLIGRTVSDRKAHDPSCVYSTVRLSAELARLLA